jgi:hypothetical protein
MKSELLRAKLRGEVCQADYAQANAEFDTEMAALDEQLQSARSNRLSLDAFLRFAQVMLIDVAGAWQRAGAEQKVRVQNLLFQSGLRYSQELRDFKHLNPCLFNTMEEMSGKNWLLASRCPDRSSDGDLLGRGGGPKASRNGHAYRAGIA